MRKVFWENPYQTELKTTVQSVNENEIVFDETIAYSESGGQESDKATINEMPILASRMDKTDPFLIYYTLPENHGLKVGDTVCMRIDWGRRNRLMRLHFTCELILVIVNRLFGQIPEGHELQPDEIDKSIRKTGAHMSEKSARVDFQLAQNMNTYLSSILSEYERIIKANLPIEKGYLDETRQIRFWKIPGYAMVPCGGTHVNTTSEVGFVNLKRKKGGKNQERIEITLKDPTAAKNEFDYAQSEKQQEEDSVNNRMNFSS